MSRTGYLVCGRYFQHALLARAPYDRAVRSLYLPELGEADLEELAVVIVSSYVDADVLAVHAPALLRFWRAGGDLVCLGAPPFDWLPGSRHEPRRTNFWWYREPGADLPLTRHHPEEAPLAGLELPTLKWHHHGVFHVPAGARTLLAADDGSAVVYTHREDASGLLVATTMDADMHTGLRFIPKAETLFDHLVRWAGARSGTVRPAAELGNPK